MEHAPQPAGSSPAGLAGSFDEYRKMASDAVRGIADTLRRQADVAGDRARPIAGYVHQAASMLDRSADRLRELDLRRVRANVEGTIRRNPATSLAVAAIAGLALGALLRRR